MRAFNSGLKKSLKCAAAVFAVALCGATASAHATLINFDDLVYIPTDPDDCFCDHELTNEYESKGLIIDGGYLGTSGTNNYLSGTPWLVLKFIGILPTKISLSVSAALEDVVYLDAHGSGFNSSKKTTGWAGPFDDTPYTANQIISFSSASGISSINIAAFYDLRIDAIIDDINCDYSATVPESSSLGLMGIGLLAGLLMLPRRNRRIG